MTDHRRRARTRTRSDATGARRCCRRKGLVKRYGRVTAIDDSDLELYPGEILAVIGDNGAGKSSLIKALSGALIPDEGEICLDGQAGPLPATRWTPGAAGIETVYQTLAVAPGPRHRRQPVPRPRGAQARHPRLGVPDARPQAHADGGQAAHERARHRHAAEHRPGGGEPLRRPAAGRRGGPVGRVRQQGRDPRRADGGARASRRATGCCS